MPFSTSWISLRRNVPEPKMPFAPSLLLPTFRISLSLTTVPVMPGLIQMPVQSVDVMRLF